LSLPVLICVCLLIYEIPTGLKPLNKHKNNFSRAQKILRGGGKFLQTQTTTPNAPCGSEESHAGFIISLIAGILIFARLIFLPFYVIIQQRCKISLSPQKSSKIQNLNKKRYFKLDVFLHAEGSYFNRQLRKQKQ